MYYNGLKKFAILNIFMPTPANHWTRLKFVINVMFPAQCWLKRSNYHVPAHSWLKQDGYATPSSCSWLKRSFVKQDGYATLPA